MSDAILLKPGAVGLDSWRRVWMGAPVTLDQDTWPAVEASAAAIARAVAEGEQVYGVTTGFGKLADRLIPNDQLEALQRNLLLSHSAGTGAALPRRVTRLALALKIASLARGYSGVRRAIIEGLLALLAHDCLPVIPGQGSVGASGDLAPLAHMCAPLIGKGEIAHRGRVMPAAEGLAACGLSPLTLGPKEGLALINGTQISTALALDGLFRIESAFTAAVIAGALSVEAAKASTRPFMPEIQAVRGHQGQADVAAALAALLAGSGIVESHANCGKVQDPYSLRCQPQVMGACLDVMRQASATLAIEANAVSDNPLVFATRDEIVSGGNFHAEPVALAADTLALAAAEIGSLSERRTALLIDPALSGLPPFLVAEPGINSGFMIAQVTAAALVSENKQIAHPASVDSIPTSANQEDHVSMATHGARRLGLMAENLGGIIAVELLAAAQGVDFHRPLRSSDALESAHAAIRERIAPWEEDRLMAPDIEAARTLIEDDALPPAPGLALPSHG